MIEHDDIAFLELTEVADLIHTRAITSLEVTEAVLARIAELDPTLQSYAHVSTDSAMAAAKKADDERARGRYRGPLHGVPVAVKDLCYTTDAPTASGTTIHAGYKSSYDATVVSRLRAAGAVLTGKLTMTEGAYTSHHPDLPVPVNPWDSQTWSGVSSSGSGVATAAGLCFGSLGSDTGGSIRLPSSMNGVTGLKPTWGRVSRYGITELAASLDHIGPMARSAKDCAALLGVIAGHDSNDPTSSLTPVPDYLAGIQAASRPPRIGIDRSLLEHFDAATQSMLDDVIAVLVSLGWTVIEIKTPDLAANASDFAALCGVETAHAHAATYPSRASEYGPALSGLIESGLAMTAVEFQHLQERRRAFTGRLRRVFNNVDLLLMPGIGFASPTLQTMDTLGSNDELLAALLVPTAPFDHAGVPTVTLPGGFTDRGTPLGFQFVAADFNEQFALQAAHQFQSVTDFHRIHPSLAFNPVSSR
ncbi:amidase [Rhodococcoides fascians]|uniref:amidase n=1 Tax=Rhodococcoides fascians TaxID=1828 RepID=UPI001D2F2486|nr:amidase [Rhodococcus fascians]CAH0235953.1 Putative amidase AmiD [Rhodococcus fascians]